jgi:hypothetical protein
MRFKFCLDNFFKNFLGWEANSTLKVK